MFNYVETRLAAMSDPALDRRLASLPTWRAEGAWRVFRTADPPCIAFTALADAAGAITLIILGACHAFPSNDENRWWDTVIRPRVLAI